MNRSTTSFVLVLVLLASFALVVGWHSSVATADSPSTSASSIAIQNIGHGTGERRLNSPGSGVGDELATQAESLSSRPAAALAPDQTTVLLEEDFENATWPAGTLWRTFDNTGTTGGEYYWANRCPGHHTARAAWAIGGGANGRNLTCGATYPHNLDSWMIYGPIDLSSYSAATLAFDFWLNSECVGTDCAEKSDRLWALASTNGVNFRGSWWAGDWASDPGAHHGGWNDRRLNLVNFVGEPQVWIAFSFDSDGTIAYPSGALVDNVVLSVEGDCTPTASISRITLDRTCYVPGSTIGVFVEVANSGGTREIEAEVSLFSGSVIWSTATSRFNVPGQQAIPLGAPADLFPGNYEVVVRLYDPNNPNCVHDSDSVTVLIDPVCGTVTPPVPTTPTPPIAPTATPEHVATLCPGQSTTEVKNIFIPSAPARADVLFAFDTTNSMGGVLASAKTNALSIMNSLSGVIPDIQFGVVDFRDYPFEPFGESTDWPYLLRQGITGNRSAVAAAINAMVHGGGRDYPEAYTRVLYESGADGAIRWRADTRKFIVMFGDDVPHDDNLNEGIINPPVNPGSAWCGNTPAGCVRDPGRDGQLGTADDLDLQTVLDLVRAHRTTLLFVVSGGGSTSQSNLVEYWRQWARRTNTGGDALPLADAAALPAAIQELVTSASSRISRLELRTVPASYQSWLTVTPPAYVDLEIPPGGMSVRFDVVIRVPEGTLPGTYTFEVKAIGDGAVYGGQGVTIHIPASCVRTPTPTPTATTTRVAPPTPTGTPFVCPPTRPIVDITCPTPNIIRNPDFERGNRSWSERSTLGRNIISTDTALEGFWSATFYGPPGAPSDEWLSQYVDIAPDATAVSFWVENFGRFAAAVNQPPITAGNYFRVSLYDLTMSTELVRLWEFDPLLPLECEIDPSFINLAPAQLDLVRGKTVALVFRFHKVTPGVHVGVKIDQVRLTVCHPGPPCNVIGDKSASPGEVVSGGEAVVTLSLTGTDGTCLPARVPADVGLVMDVSGSMRGQPLADAMTASKGFVDRLQPGIDQVALVSFSDSATVNQVLATHAGGVRAAIDGLSAGGNTNISDALARARAELGSPRHRPDNARFIVLLSDGKPNVGGDPRSEASAAKADGIRVFTIGLGTEVDPALLRELASAPSDYFFAPTSDELAAIYQRISGVLGGAPATDITITDTLSPHVTLVPNSFTGNPIPSVSADGRTLTWRIPRLGLETRIWSYRVKMTNTAGLWPTNDSASATFTNSAGQPGALTFPIPQVRVRPANEGHPLMVCRDHAGDTGTVPSNPNGEPVWDSPDIWVRNTADSGTTHQSPQLGQSNTVYVRVHNFGTAPLQNVTVNVYDAVGATSIRWPDDWAPSIGSATIARIMPGDSEVAAIPWMPTMAGHTCFLARLEAPTDPIRFDGWVPFDKNICQKNVQVLEPPSGGSTTSSTSAGNRNRGSGYGSLNVRSDNIPPGATGRIVFRSEELFERWQLAGGEVSGGELDVSTKSIRFGPAGGGLAQAGKVDLMIERLPFDGDELSGLSFEVDGLGDAAPPTLLIEQFQEDASVGGVTMRAVAQPKLYIPTAYNGVPPGAAGQAVR